MFSRDRCYGPVISFSSRGNHLGVQRDPCSGSVGKRCAAHSGISKAAFSFAQNSPFKNVRWSLPPPEGEGSAPSPALGSALFSAPPGPAR